MKKNILTYLALTLLCTSSYGQGEVVIPTPNVASLGRFGEIPVSLANGLPNISIPIYDINYGGVDVPISLDYHGGGIEIEEHPSWVGLGWSLECGGVITRVTHHGPDDYYDEDHDHNRGFYYTRGLLNVSNWNDPTYMGSLVSFSASSAGENLIDDSEPDEFFFKFGKFSGSFFLNAAGGWQVRCDDNLKIACTVSTTPFNLEQVNPYNTTSNNSTNTITLDKFFLEFTIVDQDGITYTFGGDATNIEFSRPPMSGMGIDFTSSGYPHYVTASSWHLSKIVTPTGKKIEFIYERDAAQFRTMSSIGKSSTTKIGGSIDCVAFGGGTSGIIMNPVYLKRITTPAIRLEFNRSSSEQSEYITTDPAEFMREGSGVSTSQALQLNSLNNLLTDWPDLRDWAKTYNFGYPIASPNSKGSQLPIGVYRQLNEIKVIDNINNQQKLVYRFSYSEDENVRLTLNSLKIAASGVASADNPTYTFAYNHVDLLPAYRTLQSDYWGFFNGVNYSSASTSTAFQFPGWRDVDDTKCKYGVLTSITYPTGGTTTFDWESNDYSKFVRILSSITVQTLPTSPSPNAIAGGLRIKTITSTPGFNAPTVRRKYFYVNNYNDGTGIDVSSGILGGMPRYRTAIEFTSPCALGSGGDWRVVKETDHSIRPISTTGGSSVNYSTVVELNGDNSYSIHKFSNFPESPDELASPSSNGGIFLQDDCQLSSHALDRQKVLSIEKYNNSGIKVEGTYYEYNSDPSRLGFYVKGLKYNNYPLPACFGCFSWEAHTMWPYKIYYYYNYLEKETTKQYFASGTFTTTKQFYYDFAKNKIHERVSASNGEYINTYTSFASTFLGCSCPDITNLNSHHMSAAPVEITNTRELPSGNEVELSSSLITYDNTLPVIINQKQLVTATPLHYSVSGSSSDFVPAHISGGSFLTNTNYQLGNEMPSVNIFGDVVETKDRGRTSTSYTMDFGASKITSKTVNATIHDVAHSSFEGNYMPDAYWVGLGLTLVPHSWDMGNLNFSHSSVITGDGITGKKYYKLNSAPIQTTSNLQVGKKYVVSLWVKNDPAYSMVINDGVNPVSFVAGLTINGWRYLEAKFTAQSPTGASTTNITVSGNCWIDELRVFPVDAEMETYTYDPVFGMTSKCDVKNEVTYYEYDALGRLKLESDLRKNITKKYQYGLKTTE